MINLELHHFFILVKPDAKVAGLLSAIGMCEGTGNIHEGQGTSNRRFNFSNGTLELLWVHDEGGAKNGSGRDMCLSERINDKTASPFGVIFNQKDNASIEMPFDGWNYQPVYFQPPWAFHIGANSNNIREPLCVYMPFVELGPSIGTGENKVIKSISKVKIYIPAESMSNELGVANTADRLSIGYGEEHLMEIEFDNNKSGFTKDFRPDIPLMVHW